MLCWLNRVERFVFRTALPTGGVGIGRRRNRFAVVQPVFMNTVKSLQVNSFRVGCFARFETGGCRVSAAFQVFDHQRGVLEAIVSGVFVPGHDSGDSGRQCGAQSGS